ncbi:7TM GPCR, serpentine receptor class v (Srv) family-containing protein [Strongyloides ratti]|uniref:7TM GPCR, serpentine receptor class v (Srv) family-containing protein n=1 Tax=Strongyloides ratti TaxID=34506 RepID=A0A090KZ97_STRRB|nr:7TM GPCR, serpentine receptor class v (Srv) family-containing protein [Strongyloides ratti]CEF62850.1 7TM GPCR, serpentine receptor class v (Srv) family-containing protein [Strongyloides ratti]
MYIILFSKQYSDLKSAYYQLQFYILIVDFLSYLNSNASNRLPNYGVFNNFFETLRIQEFDIRIINFICYTTIFSQYIGVVFLSLNRFTAIYLHIYYDKFWKYLLPVAVLIIYLFPLIFTWPYLCNLTVYRILWDDDGEGGYNITTKQNKCIFFDKALVVSTFSFGCSSISAVLNFASLAHLVKEKGFLALFRNNKKCPKKTISEYEMNKTRSERNMLLCSILSFFFGLLFGICSQLSAYFAERKMWRGFRINCMAISVFYDLTSLSKCWMLFITSSTIRKEIKRIFFGNSNLTRVKLINLRSSNIIPVGKKTKTEKSKSSI